MRRIIGSILLVCFVLVSLVMPTYTRAQADVSDIIRPLRQGVWYDQGPFQWYMRVFDDSNPQEMFGERYTAAQVQWVMYSIPAFFAHIFISPQVYICLISITVGAIDLIPGLDVPGGGDVGECAEIIGGFLGYNSNQGEIFANEVREKGFLSYYFNDVNPNSGVKYLYSKVNNTGLVPETYAQGFGYNALNGATFMSIMWGTTRDISYALYVLIAVVLAFMIMFRMKTSPQAVVTIQSSLPRIAIGLVLTTFSFAIAGLMIDLMYVAIGIIVTVLDNSTILASGAGNWINLFNFVTRGPLSTTGGSGGTGVVGILSGYLGLSILSYLAATLSAMVGGAVSLDVGGMFLSLGAVFASPMFVAFIGLVVFFQCIRIIWFLLRTYISIIMLIILAPITLTFGVLPSVGFKSWFRNLAANLAVYPIISLMVILMYAFAAAGFGPINNILNNLIPNDALGGLVGYPIDVNPNLLNGQPWSPPLSMFEDNQGFVFLMISLVLFFLIPKVGNMIKAALSGKPFDMEGAITAVAGGAAGSALYMATQQDTKLGSLYGKTSSKITGSLYDMGLNDKKWRDYSAGKSSFNAAYPKPKSGGNSTGATPSGGAGQPRP